MISKRKIALGVILASLGAAAYAAQGLQADNVIQMADVPDILQYATRPERRQRHVRLDLLDQFRVTRQNNQGTDL